MRSLYKHKRVRSMNEPFDTGNLWLQAKWKRVRDVVIVVNRLKKVTEDI